MALRITQRLMTEHSLNAMQLSMERLSRSQEHLSTGRLINRPSDDPTGTNSAMRMREQITANDQYARNASDGLAWMGRTDSTLMTMSDQVNRARELILRGANEGNLSAQAKEALATELDQIRESLFSLSNTQHLGRPLFGGTTGGGAAFAHVVDPAADPLEITDDPEAPIAYIGTPRVDGSGGTGVISRTVGDGVEVQINTLGSQAFTTDATDLFAVLKSASDKLSGVTSGDVSDDLADLDTVHDKMLTALADVGTRYGRVESALQSVNDAQLDMQASLSEVENVDIAKAIVDLQMQEVAYQAALGATARVIQPSLIDFLR
jgi:flagellar hook-associated protein 3 FlgL